MDATLFIGIHGSGKSTFLAQEFADTHIRVNFDMLRTPKSPLQLSTKPISESALLRVGHP